MDHSEILFQIRVMGLEAAVSNANAITDDGQPAVELRKGEDRELFTGFASSSDVYVLAALGLIARFGPMTSQQAGRLGGQAKTERKRAASRLNGLKGGRKRKVQEGVV